MLYIHRDAKQREQNCGEGLCQQQRKLLLLYLLVLPLPLLLLPLQPLLPIHYSFIFGQYYFSSIWKSSSTSFSASSASTGGNFPLPSAKVAKHFSVLMAGQFDGHCSMCTVWRVHCDFCTKIVWLCTQLAVGTIRLSCSVCKLVKDICTKRVWLAKVN